MRHVETQARPNNIDIRPMSFYYGRPGVYKIYFPHLIINVLISEINILLTHTSLINRSN